MGEDIKEDYTPIATGTGLVLYDKWRFLVFDFFGDLNSSKIQIITILLTNYFFFFLFMYLP